jgi:hypothetical protein
LKNAAKAETYQVMVSFRYFVTIREGAATVARVVILAQSAADAKRQADAIASLFPGRSAQLAAASDIVSATSN